MFSRRERITVIGVFERHDGNNLIKRARCVIYATVCVLDFFYDALWELEWLFFVCCVCRHGVVIKPVFRFVYTCVRTFCSRIA